MSDKVKALREALRVLRLEEARLRSSALAYSCGIGSVVELTAAADHYGSAARDYKALERALLGDGLTLTPDEAEVAR